MVGERGSTSSTHRSLFLTITLRYSFHHTSLLFRFGVRGIPSLICLDYDTRVVSNVGRNDVMQYREPDECIGVWSSLLDIDYYDEIDARAGEDERKRKEQRKEEASKFAAAGAANAGEGGAAAKPPARKDMLKSKIKEIFGELVKEGVERNKAAARAIKEATAAINAMQLGSLGGGQGGGGSWYKER